MNEKYDVTRQAWRLCSNKTRFVWLKWYDHISESIIRSYYAKFAWRINLIHVSFHSLRNFIGKFVTSILKFKKILTHLTLQSTYMLKENPEFNINFTFIVAQILYAWKKEVAPVRKTRNINTKMVIGYKKTVSKKKSIRMAVFPRRDSTIWKRPKASTVIVPRIFVIRASEPAKRLFSTIRTPCP